MAGLRYEKKAKAYLASLLPGQFIDGPWFSYRRLNDHQRRFCQPDGFAFDSSTKHLTIFEIKLRWCESAAPQLSLYHSVLGEALRPASTSLACVTRSFDPAIPFAGRAVLIDELFEAVALQEGAPQIINVLTWR
jgi:hypothetical protein